MDRFFDEKIDNGKRLLTLVNLYYKAHLWLIGWHLKGMDVAKPFPVNKSEMEALDIGNEELLSLLIANDLTNPWVRATDFFDYLTFDKEIKQAMPGRGIDGTKIISLHMKPDLDLLPHTQFMQVFINTCDELDLKYKEQLFEYQRIVFENPLSFITFIENSGNQITEVRQRLRDWHICETALLEQYNLSRKFDKKNKPKGNLLSGKSREKVITFLRKNLQSLDPSDPRLHCLKLKRSEMAEITGAAARTIRKWDNKGTAPGGLHWPEPEKNKSGHCLYLISKYITAMQRLQWKKSTLS